MSDAGRKQEETAASGEPEGTVYIVDDDAQVREYVAWLLESTGWDVRSFESPREFLESYRDDLPACVITDLRMPEISGLDLQAELMKRSPHLPIIMMSAYADIPAAVQAVRGGALDFLEKPFDRDTLVARVRTALIKSKGARQHAQERARLSAAMARLTPRQRAVLAGLVEGKPSKVIAAELGVSARTIDVHRFRLMHSLGAESLPDLFRMVLMVQGERPPEPDSPKS